MIRRVVDVDFNWMREDGRLIVWQPSFVPLKIGDPIVARDLDEDMEFDGEVTGMSEDGQRLYLTMDWEPAA